MLGIAVLSYRSGGGRDGYVLSAFIGVVAVALECEVAALVFLALAVGVARFLARDVGHEEACGGSWEHVCERSLFFLRTPIFKIMLPPASRSPSKPTGCCSATDARSTDQLIMEDCSKSVW